MPASPPVLPASTESVSPAVDAPPRLAIFPPVLQSPSLDPAKRNGQAAYEFKFLLSETVAREVELRLAPHMMIDPHADQKGRGYHITTLYCDTANLDVFHRRGRHKLFKFRLRRYDHASRIFLERKSKRGEVVRKKRSSVDLDLLGQLAQDTASLPGGAAWFRRQLDRNQLRPVCLIEYSRVAFLSPGSDGPMRLTFDRSITGETHREWSLERSGERLPLLSGHVVCEFKFRGAMPLLFKSVVQELRLIPCGISKYRNCIQASGLANGLVEPRSNADA